MSTMPPSFPPSTMRAWQYSSSKGGIEKTLKLNASVPVPKPKPNQHLVQVIAVSLNPVDYKPAEIPLVTRWNGLSTPGIDFAGRICTPAAGSSLKSGQLVFGASVTSMSAGGALKEFTLIQEDNAVAIPEGVDAVSASTGVIAALTAYQSLVSRVKSGDKVFINGGSGGCGVFGIQIAKALGCHVTVTCSTANVELCKSLGADDVVDYKKGNVIDALKAGGYNFDHMIDNVGYDPQLYWRSHEFSKPGAEYVMIAGVITVAGVVDSIKRRVLPGSLGGGKRKCVSFLAKVEVDQLTQIGAWMKEGKIKAVVDEKFAFEDTPKAFTKLKTGRTKGKLVIDVAPEASVKTSST